MGDVTYEELELKSADGVDLFARTWSPIGSSKAWIAFSPGLSDHSGRYDVLGRTLANAGYGLVMADLRGHGRSDGKRGHIDRFSQYNDDLTAAVSYAREQDPPALFLGGHSLGGLNAARMAVENPKGIRGLILSGPALKLGFEPPGWKVAVAKLMSRVFPKLTMGSGIDERDLTHDEEVVERMRNDHFNHGVVTARWFIEYIKAQDEVFEKAAEAKMAMLIMHGDQDKLAALSGSEEFYRQAGGQAKTLKIYEGFYHEVFNEIDKERVFKDLIEWLDSLTA